MSLQRHNSTHNRVQQWGLPTVWLEPGQPVQVSIFLQLPLGKKWWTKGFLFGDSAEQVLHLFFIEKMKSQEMGFLNKWAFK